MASKILRLVNSLLRVLVTLLAAYILAVSIYHIQRIVKEGFSPSNAFYAIIVISGVAVIWGLCSILGSFLPHWIFAPILLFDLLLMGGFIAISILLRRAANARCQSATFNNYAVGAYSLWTKHSTSPYIHRPRIRCNLDKAAFGIAVATAVIFALLALMSFVLFQNHRRNRAFGPGPANSYSVAGYGPSKSKRANRLSGDTAMTEPGATSNVQLNGGGSHPVGAAGQTTSAYRSPAADAGRFDPGLTHQNGSMARPAYQV